MDRIGPLISEMRGGNEEATDELLNLALSRPEDLFSHIDKLVETWWTGDGAASDGAFAVISLLSESETDPLVRITPQVISRIQSRKINYVDAYRFLSKVATHERSCPLIFDATEEAWAYLHANEHISPEEKGYFGTYLKQAILSPVTVVHVEKHTTAMIERKANHISAPERLDLLNDLLFIERNYNIVVEHNMSGSL